MGNEGLGWDYLLKMVHNPCGNCYWVGATPNIDFKKVATYPTFVCVKVLNIYGRCVFFNSK